MLKCPECGTPIKEGQTTCSSCGVRIKTLSVEITAHINLLKKKIESSPPNAGLHIDLAGLYQKHEYITEALNEYQKAISIDPSNYDGHIKSAIIHLGKRELEKAESSFRQALHLNPRSNEALVGLFRTYYLQNKTDEAIVVGEKVVQASPNKTDFHRMLKELYLKKADLNKALAAMQHMESLAPQDTAIITEIADFHRKNNNVQGAIEYYQKAIVLQPKDIETNLRAARLLHDNFEYDKVIGNLKDFPDTPDLLPEPASLIHCYLGLAYFHKGDFARARSAADKINIDAPIADLTNRKTIAMLFYKIGQHLHQNKKLGSAVAYLEKAERFDAESADVKHLLQDSRASLQATNREIIKKGAVVAAIAVGGIAVLILLWTFSHNRIRIQIEPPEETRVYVDGKILKTDFGKPGVISSPTMFLGNHSIIAEKEGYEKWQGYVNVAFGKQTNVRIDLVPVYYSLKINSLPESASVYIDNNFMGKTPFLSDRVLAHPHDIEVMYDGYAPWRGKLSATKNDTADLGTVYLRNLAGKWRGKIGEDAYMYSASFTMEIKQKGSSITLIYTHRVSDNRSYSGEIRGRMEKDELLAEGVANYRYLNVFYWARSKKKISITGKMTDDWNRIEGTHQVEGLGTHSWWAERTKQGR